MTLLLTGFPSFADVERNPSEQIVAALDGSTIGGHEVVGRVLPVSAERTPGAVRAAIAETSPRLALLLGVAPGRAGALDRAHGGQPLRLPRRPTTTARSPSTSRSSPARPSRTSRPCRSGASSRPGRRPGIPGYVSESAGLFLCNAAMYTALHATAAGGPPAGFLHLPSLPERGRRSARAAAEHAARDPDRGRAASRSRQSVAALAA